MKLPRNLPMQDVILLVLIPSLLLVTAGYGFIIYSDLYKVILEGFDRKLYAVSTSSAAFIRGADHEKIYALKSISAIAYDGRSNLLYGYDGRAKSLVTIDPTEGRASELGSLESEIKSLAFHPQDGSLYGLSGLPPLLVKIDPRLLTVTRIAELSSSIKKIAFDSRGTLYGIGLALQRINPVTGHSMQGPAIAAGELAGFVWSEKEEVFIGLEAETGRLLRIEVKTGELKELGNITATIEPPPAPAPVEGEEAEEPTPPVEIALPAHGLSASAEEGILFASTDRLVKIDLATGLSDPHGFIEGFRNEDTQLYLKYVKPMRKIMNALDLTYHYSVALPRQDVIAYVLDATEGEDHSVLGTEEDTPSDEWNRLNDVLTTGRPSASPIQALDIWGLLKIGSAPIRDDTGKAVGLVGADVNISVINRKTRVALLQVLAIGAVAMLLALVVSFSISRKLLEPINQLRSGALRVAAGYYGQELKVKRPRELREISEAFNEITHALESRVSRVKQETTEFENRRRSSELCCQLNHYAEETASASCRILSRAREEGKHQVSGAIEGETYSIIWIAEPLSDPLDAARMKAGIKAALHRLVAQHGVDMDALEPWLAQIFIDEIAAWLVYDKHAGELRAVCHQGIWNTVFSHEGATPAWTPLRTARLQIASGHTAAFSSTPQGEEIVLLRKAANDADWHSIEEVVARFRHHSLSQEGRRSYITEEAHGA